MAQSIKNRVFGSDIPLKIKQKIELRQKLSERSISPGEVVSDSRYGDEYSAADFGPMNTAGVADLSSRSPFIRLWTAVDIQQAEETQKDVIDEKDYDSWYQSRDEDTYLKPQGDKKYQEFKWVKFPNSRKVYQLGNHNLNTEEKKPGTPITQGIEAGDTNISSAHMKALTPYEQETDHNVFLKPPAGITGMTSETEGSLGAVKRTTVNFIVHNFHDFEQIYLKYFLKPGHQMFVDFGWDTGYLYDPDVILSNETKMNDILFGEKGYVTLSQGDMETIYGHVVNYDAKLRPDGGFDCSVEIMSKNFSLISTRVGDSWKKRVERGLDVEIVGVAASGLSGISTFYEAARQWTTSLTKSKDVYNSVIENLATVFGASGLSQPGEVSANDNETVAARLALRNGVFIRWEGKSEFHIYVNWGWFEDQFLNTQFGYSDTESNLANRTKKARELNDQRTFAKFDSSDSYMNWSNDFNLEMGEQSAGDPDALRERLLFPATWGSNGSTYNIDRKTRPYSPGGVVTEEGDFDADPEKLPAWTRNDTEGAVEFFKKLEEKDKKNYRIPFRECFFSVKFLKKCLTQGDGIYDFVREFSSEIKRVTRGAVDIGLRSNSYGMHSMAFVDKNKVLNDGSITTEMSAGSFFDRLLMFNPYAPDTIVKKYDLSFEMPKDGLGNMIAIQGNSNSNLSGDIGVIKDHSLRSLLRGFREMEDLERKESVLNEDGTFDDLGDHFVRSLPTYGSDYAALRQLNQALGEEKLGNFGFDQTDLIWGGDRHDNEHYLQSNNEFKQNGAISDINELIRGNNYLGDGGDLRLPQVVYTNLDTVGFDYSHLDYYIYHNVTGADSSGYEYNWSYYKDLSADYQNKLTINTDGGSFSTLSDTLTLAQPNTQLLHAFEGTVPLGDGVGGEGFASDVHEKGLNRTLRDIASKIQENINDPADSGESPGNDEGGSNTEADVAHATKRGYYLVNSITEYNRSKKAVIANTLYSPIIPIKAGLTLHGISSLVPGDLCRIHYLPKYYRNNIFFQISKVSHEVNSSTWNTSLETIMRTKPLEKSENFDKDKIYIQKSFLTSLQLRDIGEYIKYFGPMKPVDLKTLYRWEAPEEVKNTISFTWNLNMHMADASRTAMGYNRGRTIPVTKPNNIQYCFLVDTSDELADDNDTHEKEVVLPWFWPHHEDDDTSKIDKIFEQFPHKLSSNTHTDRSNTRTPGGNRAPFPEDTDSQSQNDDCGHFEHNSDLSGNLYNTITYQWDSDWYFFRGMAGYNGSFAVKTKHWGPNKKFLLFTSKHIGDNGREWVIVPYLENGNWGPIDDMFSLLQGHKYEPRIFVDNTAEELKKKEIQDEIDARLNSNPPESQNLEGEFEELKDASLSGDTNEIQEKAAKLTKKVSDGDLCVPPPQGWATSDDEVTPYRWKKPTACEEDIDLDIPDLDVDEGSDVEDDEEVPVDTSTKCAREKADQGYTCQETMDRQSGSEGCLSGYCEDDPSPTWMCCTPDVFDAEDEVGGGADTGAGAEEDTSTGVCTMTDGSEQELSESECANAGGTWQYTGGLEDTISCDKPCVLGSDCNEYGGNEHCLYDERFDTTFGCCVGYTDNDYEGLTEEECADPMMAWNGVWNEETQTCGDGQWDYGEGEYDNWQDENCHNCWNDAACTNDLGPCHECVFAGSDGNLSGCCQPIEGCVPGDDGSGTAVCTSCSSVADCLVAGFSSPVCYEGCCVEGSGQNIYGCTDPCCVNYNSVANIDNNSCQDCDYTNCGTSESAEDGTIPGGQSTACTDPAACNYDSTVDSNADTSSCVYPVDGQDCDGTPCNCEFIDGIATGCEGMGDSVYCDGCHCVDPTQEGDGFEDTDDCLVCTGVEDCPNDTDICYEGCCYEQEGEGEAEEGEAEEGEGEAEEGEGEESQCNSVDDIEPGCECCGVGSYQIETEYGCDPNSTKPVCDGCVCKELAFDRYRCYNMDTGNRCEQSVTGPHLTLQDCFNSAAYGCDSGECCSEGEIDDIEESGECISCGFGASGDAYCEQYIPGTTCQNTWFDGNWGGCCVPTEEPDDEVVDEPECEYPCSNIDDCLNAGFANAICYQGCCDGEMSEGEDPEMDMPGTDCPIEEGCDCCIHPTSGNQTGCVEGQECLDGCTCSGGEEEGEEESEEGTSDPNTCEIVPECDCCRTENGATTGCSNTQWCEDGCNCVDITWDKYGCYDGICQQNVQGPFETIQECFNSLSQGCGLMECCPEGEGEQEETTEPITGCTDTAACNYNSNATEDDGSCVQPAYECMDGTIKCSEDECDDSDYCDNGMKKCGGGRGGDSFCEAEYGMEYECVWIGWNKCCQLKDADCNGVPGGDAYIDDCGTCVGGTTGKVENEVCTGCMDQNACNYNAGASISCDGCCEYPNEGEDCEGNCTLTTDEGCECGVVKDCAGVCGGNAVVDECGVCGGDGSTCDSCIEINSDTPCGSPDTGCYPYVCPQEEPTACNPGTCEECIYPQANEDCDGNCLVEVDECGVCGGNGRTFECWNGEMVCDESQCEDEDDYCDNGMLKCPGGAEGDLFCEQNYGPEYECKLILFSRCCVLKDEDDCGVPGGDNSTCSDCAGVPNGSAYTDNCGQCVGGDTGLSPCEADCAGEYGGDAEIDMCGVCGGDNTTGCKDNDCETYCNCDGDILDPCGICGGDGTSCDECSEVDPNKPCGTPPNCYAPNDGCDCTQPEGSVVDECGICNGGGVQQDCGCGAPGEFGYPDSGIPGFESCDCDGNIDQGCGCGQPAPDELNTCCEAGDKDDCGVCNGGNADKDCNGVCFGEYVDCMSETGCAGCELPGNCPEQDCNFQCLLKDDPNFAEYDDCGNCSDSQTYCNGVGDGYDCCFDGPGCQVCPDVGDGICNKCPEWSFVPEDCKECDIIS